MTLKRDSVGNYLPCLTVMGYWCLMPHSTIFQLYRGNQFYCRSKPEVHVKITNQQQLANKADHKYHSPQVVIKLAT
jgi:hypothetical protein